MLVVPAVDVLESLNRLVHGLKSEYALTHRQHVAEPRVLDNHGLAGRQVTDAAVAEPSAPTDHVSVFGDGELGCRLMNEVLVIAHGVGDADSIHDLPAAGVDRRGRPTSHRHAEVGVDVPLNLQKAG